MREGVYRGADVVGEAGQRELGGAKAAADGGLRLAKHGLEPGLGERDGGGETVGSRADDDGVRSHRG